MQAATNRPTEHGHLQSCGCGRFDNTGRRTDVPPPGAPEAGVYRSGLRRLRRAEAITRRTVACGSRTCRAIAAGPRPAPKAARISRSCPSVTVVVGSGAPDFDPAGVAGPDFCERRAPAAAGFCPASRPRRRSSAATAFARRSSCSSSSRRSDRPRPLGRARLGALAGRSAPGAQDPASGARRRSPLSPRSRVITRRTVRVMDPVRWNLSRLPIRPQGLHRSGGGR